MVNWGLGLSLFIIACFRIFGGNQQLLNSRKFVNYEGLLPGVKAKERIILYFWQFRKCHLTPKNTLSSRRWSNILTSLLTVTNLVSLCRAPIKRKSRHGAVSHVTRDWSRDWDCFLIQVLPARPWSSGYHG